MRNVLRFGLCSIILTLLNSELTVVNPVCPGDLLNIGGRFARHMDMLNKCITLAEVTFQKHVKTTWQEHFTQECLTQYPEGQVLQWDPTKFPDEAVIKPSFWGIPHNLHVLNGLVYSVTKFDLNLIWLTLFPTKSISDPTTCVFNKNSNWRTESKSSYCNFTDTMLSQLDTVKQSWQSLCFIFSSSSYLNLTLQTQLVECSHINYRPTLTAICVHDFLENCIQFKEGGCESCVENWSGKHCQLNLKNPCATYVCGGHGTCKSQPSGTYTCICETSHFGDKCQFAKELCLPATCKNGGTCRSLVGGYWCECTAGYTGQFCEQDINECEMNICKNNAKCTNRAGSFTCTCLPGTFGEFCEQNIDDCASRPCVHANQCIDLINDFKCVCKPGYTGKMCRTDINECESNPCQNKGTCINEINQFKCICPPEYSGITCAGDITFCDRTICKNGGTCIDDGENSKCKCTEKYTGTYCEAEKIMCSDGICGSGKCIQGDLQFKCDCSNSGYKGPQCNILINQCESSPCENGGTCFNKIGKYVCQCKVNWTGKKCDIVTHICDTQNPCQNGATCRRSGSGYTCICPFGTTGKICTEEPTETSRIENPKSALWYIVYAGIAVCCIIICVLFMLKYYRKPTSKHTRSGRNSSRKEFSRIEKGIKSAKREKGSLHSSFDRDYSQSSDSHRSRKKARTLKNIRKKHNTNRKNSYFDDKKFHRKRYKPSKNYISSKY